MEKRLLLNQYRNVDSDMANMTVPIDLGNNKELIVDDKFAENVNLYSVYLDEREVCTKVRLTAQINLIASNIIFNSVTEIVKNEGANNCECLNFTPKTIPHTLGKDASTYLWGSKIEEAVMDTQISSTNYDDFNYTYLCGIDIFDNHIIRSKSKFPVSYLYGRDSGDTVYNTIEDYYRDRWGRVNGYTQTRGQNGHIGPQFLHKYNKENIMTFSESLEKNLENRNGWIGFINKGQMISTGFSGSVESFSVGIENVINNESKNKFIHLFPGKDRYEFKPHYNSARNRYEKNWEYVITYPSSHTTDGIPFINPYLDTLKIAQIDENQHDDDGIYRCVVYSVSKHGLVPGDKINMYRSRSDDDSVFDTVELNMNVDNVIDEYVFSVYTSDLICKKWISAFDEEAQTEYGIEHVAGTIFTSAIGQIISVSDYLNVDFDTEGGHIGSNNLSFAKVVNGVQCKYYVRMMSRLPNFDFYDKELTEENIYKPEISGHTAVEEYSKEEYERQSSVSKLGFSKNIYGDDMYQIVFNDDIDISLIKDNLGRPLTSLYLTFFKTNYGRTEWYVDKTVNSEDVEWSRCFGKLNCGFEYSPYIDDGKWDEGNIHVMNNIGMLKGLVTKAVTSPSGGEDDDEIRYKVDSVYYGDLCMYSPSECIETVIQDLQHRFNTMQREFSKYDDKSFSGFSKVYYQDIIYDDNEEQGISRGGNPGFLVDKSTYDETADSKPEGCFYKANHEIPIRTFSQTLRRFTPDMISVSSFEPDYATSSCTVHTSSEHGFFSGGSVCVYDSVNGTIYDAEKLDITDTNGLLITWDYEESDSPNSADGLMIYEVSEKIPSYAEPVPDSPGSYIWRNIVPNGFEETEGIIEDYPFVNGCLYVNKEINLFLRRQDPFGQFGLANQAIYYGLPPVTGKINPYEEGTAMNYDDTINEGYVTC